jgi:hypothetical protein
VLWDVHYERRNNELPDKEAESSELTKPIYVFSELEFKQSYFENTEAVLPHFSAPNEHCVSLSARWDC